MYKKTIKFWQIPDVVCKKILATSFLPRIEENQISWYILVRLVRSISGRCFILMNEKFFDLKKEKQDRMINAALKVFAGKGYEHASTDEMVREAGISKGLLFHYFGSKLGLYAFVYDYSVRYLMLELTTGVSKEETDYFTLLEQIKGAQLMVMRNYPCMLLFLKQCEKERVKEALEAIEDKREILPGQYLSIMERADLSRLKEGTDAERLSKIIDFTLTGFMQEMFERDAFQPEHYHEEAKIYLNMLRNLSYH